MATPKTWTANDVEMQQLRLERVGADIIAYRDFVFVDDQAQPLSELGLQLFQATVEIAEIPAGVLSALQTIDNWFYSQILNQEGMT